MPLNSNATKARTNLARRTTGFSLDFSDLDEDKYEDNFFPQWMWTVVWMITLVVMDLMLYGLMIPLVSIYIGGKILSLADLKLNAIWETVFVVFVVFVILSTVFKGKQESYFWKQFLAGQSQFKRILMIRDLVNTATIGFLIYKLLMTVQNIIRDHGMLSQNLHEGVLYVTLSPFLDDNTLENNMNVKPSYRPDYHNPRDIMEEWIDEDPLSIFFTWIGSWFGGQPSPQSTISFDGYLRLKQLRSMAINGATLILTVAQLTAAITKLMYFTSLFNYQRAMNIFIEMQQNGEFGDGEELEDVEVETAEEVPGSSVGNQMETVQVFQNEKSASVPPPKSITTGQATKNFRLQKGSRP